MLLKLRMFPPRPLVHFGLPLSRAVWSSKMPLANAPAILNLLDGPVGVDPVFSHYLVQVSDDAQVSCLLS